MNSTDASQLLQLRLVAREFGANGLIYRRVKRDGLLAIYSVHSKSGKLYGFEVVILSVAPAAVIMGQEYPEREVYPCNEQFGVTGWYFPSRDDAEQRFQQLSAGRTARDASGCASHTDANTAFAFKSPKTPPVKGIKTKVHYV